MENILSGNPLINLAGQQQKMNQSQNTFRVKRRYLTYTHKHTLMHNECCICGENFLHLSLNIINSFVNIFLGGMMMLCSKTAPKEWTRHGKRNALLMIRCALSSTRNLWRNMLSKGLVVC